MKSSHAHFISTSRVMGSETSGAGFADFAVRGMVSAGISQMKVDFGGTWVAFRDFATRFFRGKKNGAGASGLLGQSEA